MAIIGPTNNIEEDTLTHTSFVNLESIDVNYKNMFDLRVCVLSSGDIKDHFIVVNIGGVINNYLSIGDISINTLNEWEAGLGRNTYSSGGSYVAFDKGLNTWVIGDLEEPEEGSQVVGEKTSLIGVGLLPEPYANIHIDSRFEEIPVSLLEICEPEIFFNIKEKIAHVSFGGTTQSGIILT